MFFEKLRQRLLRWQWLKNKYPLRNSGAFVSQIKPEPGDAFVTITKDGVIFPKLIRLLSRNSANESAEGLNTLVFTMDEACFGKNQPIMLADGSKRYIADIVNSKDGCEVLSYNFSTKTVEKKRVVNWHKYRTAGRPMVRVTLNESKFKYAKVLTGTVNHHIFTDKGITQLGELKVGDKVYCRGVFMSDAQREMALGSLLGDASVTRSFNLQFTHGQDQVDYLKFKEDTFSAFLLKRRETKSGYSPDRKVYQSLLRVCEDTHALRKMCYSGRDGRKYVSKQWADALTVRSLAYFYLDDGSLVRGGYTRHTGIRSEYLSVQFSGYSFSSTEIRRLVRAFARLGYRVTTFKDGRYAGEDRGYVINMSSTVARRFLVDICKFVPASMGYKLGIINGTATAVDSHTEVKLLPVVSTAQLADKRSHTWVYDIEVEDNHNYFASDVLVSNSAFSDGSNSRNADKLYRVLRSSSRTRFGNMGKGFIISYPRELNDFTMRMYAANLGNLHVLTDKAATWEVLPKGLRFKTGNFVFEGKLIPNELKEDFEKNPTEAKMMYMAEPPESEHGFLEYPEKIMDCVVPGSRGLVGVEDYIKDGKVCKRIINFAPGIQSNRDYIVTVDLGRSEDTAALSVFHREDAKGQAIFVQDLVTGWTPDKPNKYVVSFTDITEFILAISKRINIIGCWFDQWQSVSMRETLSANAIPAYEYMLDYADHKTFKELIYTKRYRLLPFEPQIKEMRKLVDTGTKVDHPKGQHNDYVSTIVGATKVFMAKYASTNTGDEWGDVETIEENLTTGDPWS